MEFKIGCDPEIFVGDNASVRSIIGKVGGTKDNPKELPIGKGFAVQEDNVALEFNVPPSSSKNEFIGNVMGAMSFLSEMLLQQHGLQFVNKSAVSFPDDELRDPRALVFGCDPDYNAWTSRVNPRPSAADKNLRSCGGHIHIGLDDSWLPDKKRKLIHAMDLYISVPAVFMDQGHLRKELYGKAGAFRNKSYGVEYRTPSNFWVWNPELIGWVYDNTARAISFTDSKEIPEEDGEAIRYAINNNDQKTAMMLVNRYNLDVRNA